MRHKWCVIAFVTLNTPYEKMAKEQFIPSLKSNGVPYLVKGVKNKGNWLLNIAYKPWIIRGFLNNYPVDAVYLDVDAIIMRYPVLFDRLANARPFDRLGAYDIGFHLINLRARYELDHDKTEPFAGTLYFRNNANSLRFLNEWEFLCGKNPKAGEHEHFQALIKHKKNWFRFYNLPQEYAYIETLPDGRKTLNPVGEPVIAHTQASRMYRKEINNGIPKI